MNKVSKKVRQITDASIIVAIYCVFLLISRMTGSLLEYDLFFVLPIPIALYAYKYGFKISTIPLVSTTLLSIVICTTPFSSIVYVLPSLFIGALFGGVLIKTNLKSIYIILIITGIALVTEILSSIVLSSILGIQNIFMEIEEIVNIMGDWLPRLHVNNIDLPFFQAVLEGIIPSTLIIISLLDAVLIYLLFNLIVLKGKMFRFYAKKPTLSFINAPKWLSILYIILLPLFFYSLMNFSEENKTLHIIYIILINAFVVLTMVYIYFGVKVSALFSKFHRKNWMIIIIYLCVLIPPFQLLLVAIGLFDSFYEMNRNLIDNKNWNE